MMRASKRTMLELHRTIAMRKPRIMTAPFTTLLGPPELHKQPPPQSTPPTDPFMDLMVSNFNNAPAVAPPPLMGYTDNGSPTYLSTGNPCVDFFFHVVPNTPPQTVSQRLYQAWKQDPLTSLKLVCNLRGIRGTGKSDKEGFYASAVWLHQNHPKTLALNIPPMVKFGYFKDWLEILFRLLEGLGVREKQKIENFERRCRGRRFWRGKKKLEIDEREEKRIAMARKVYDRYQKDTDFRFLHEKISDLLAECLKADMEYLKTGNIFKISLAAKWCPSIGSSFDKSTLICESIARKVFPKEAYPEYEGIEEAHYAYRIRDRLRKDVLVPLRKVLELPEVYIGYNKWGEIPYNRVASVAMTLYKERFFKHDEERFKKYLFNVKSGKSKIAAGALLPHQIIAGLRDGGEVAELQWKRMVSDLSEKGKLKNCMAISDVSGSMYGTPIVVSVALGILVSELSEEPWKGKLITFSENPELQLVEGTNLKEKTRFVQTMNWNCNTDFQKVFDAILEVAVNGKLKEDEMIKRLFVFSDMEFDQASLNPWETDYQAIVRKFTEKGYGNCVPEIVFWNLRDSKATPVPSTQNGVALVSGFSKNLLKLFLNDEDLVIDPVSVMEAAISGQEYQKLVVVD